MIVIDSDVATAMALDSEDGRAVKALLLEGEEAIAPTLLFAEIANTFAKYVKGNILTLKEAEEKAPLALGFIDNFVENQSLWLEAMCESIRLKHSAYDLIYAILARRYGATLFTLDQKLQRLCLANGIECIYTDTEF